MNPDKLNETICKEYPHINGVLVQQHGEVLHEQYFNGYANGETRHVYSVTKSISSALIGIAIDKGFLLGIDTPILEFFPDYIPSDSASPIAEVTVKDLLSMVVPYRYEEEPFEQYFSSEDWVHFALDAIGGEGSIGSFVYSPIMGAHILSAILAKATNQTVFAFAQECLFTPLGMKVPASIVLHDEQEHRAVMADRTTRGWVEDPKGYNTASWGLFLTPQDMVKFGQLYLDGGMYQGKRIISKQWIEESTSRHSSCGGLAYGYLWWLPQGCFCAIGDGGNVIACFPGLDAVVVLTGEFVVDAKDPMTLLMGDILPQLLE